MTKKVPLWLSLLLIVIAAVIAFQGAFIALGGYNKSSGSGTVAGDTLGSSVYISDDVLEKLQYVSYLYKTYYPKDYDTDTAEDYILKGFVAGTGDRYGEYITAEELADYNELISGSYVGIGASVIYDAVYGLVQIVNIYKDSPAAAGGLCEGDYIYAVDGESAYDLGYNGTVSKVRGEAGTDVVLTVLRGSDLSEKLDLTLTRAAVTEEAVISHAYAPDESVEVIRIVQFTSTMPEQFTQAMAAAKARGARAVVVDLRGNPGGDLNAICEVLDSILPEGPIITIKYKTGEDETLTSSASYDDMPMAVLVNGSTASAAELFAAAVKDYDRAMLIGTTTYGKGTMQSTLAVADGDYLKLTVAYYYPPFSDNYDGVGVTPDVEVELSEELEGINMFRYTDETDNQLAVAAEAARMAADSAAEK